MSRDDVPGFPFEIRRGDHGSDFPIEARTFYNSTESSVSDPSELRWQRGTLPDPQTLSLGTRVLVFLRTETDTVIEEYVVAPNKMNVAAWLTPIVDLPLERLLWAGSGEHKKPWFGVVAWANL